MNKRQEAQESDQERENGGGEVLLTGATGFVGSYLYEALNTAGERVRCATRDPQAAASAQPRRHWTLLDVDRPETLEPALAGCKAAYYLIHSMDDGADYAKRESQAAEAFSKAAHQAGVERIIYLGGVAPAGKPSRHLASRLATGELLRGGPVPAVELRAAMVMGAGSASWQMVRDLAARLPAMLLPRWLSNRSQPVFIDDVVVALLASLDLPLETSAWFDLPGTEVLTHRDLLGRVAKRLGHRPVLLDVPVLTPSLSSYWIAAVTRTDLHLARELVQGLTSDLLPSGDILWQHIGAGGRPYQPTTVDRAIELCLEDEKAEQTPSGAACERIAAAVRTRRETGP